MTHTKMIHFVGGPLDGKTREIARDLTMYEIDEPPPPEEFAPGEIPVGFFPPFHKYIYEESPDDSNVFICKKKVHS